MIKRETLTELEDLIKKDPSKTCYQLAAGKMFAVTADDTNCLTGENNRLVGKTTIKDREFTIYVGGTR